jgi:putative aldouronate transport system substrate-binding protein
VATSYPSESSAGVSRRGFLAGALATAVGLPLLNACAPPSAPSSPATGGGAPAGAKPGAAAKSVYPTYVPVANGPKPDYHDDNPLYSDAFDNYPQNPIKANPNAPGTGSVVNVLVTAYFPLPTPIEQNPTWQAVNKALNADMRLSMAPGADYRVKFATTMSGADADLPDIMHIFFGYSIAPNLPQFFKSKCADLTPYLSGDAAKDYPYLAAIPTPAWKNSVSVVDGALYLIPIHRQMTSIPPRGGNFFKNVDMWDKELGQDYLPKNADDFKKALATLTHPQENRWGIGSFGTNDTLFGIGSFAQMFNAPNNWKLDASGKLIRDRETEEYKAAISFQRDLFAAGSYWPDSLSSTNARSDFVGKKFAVSPEGQGNSWVDFWQRGLQQNPQTRFGMLKPFPAQDSQKPVHFLGTGFVSMNVLKKASPDRIKELLRIMNWLASPFGTQEDLLLTYGLKDQDYTLDDKGNPKPISGAEGRAGYVPWRYIAQHPWVYYQAGLDGFAKASHDAELATIPIGVDDPTNGFYAPTLYGKGINADMAWQDGVRQIIRGDQPVSDLDRLNKEWQAAAGDQIRKEYMDAMAAAKA